MAQTSFFKSCLGVFQGGGCRAAAFVGAYEEALRSGVSFTELAGTSAGSIAAALIGAGANPSQLRDAINKLNFQSFMIPPDRVASRGIAGALLGFASTKLADLAFDQGFYSSVAVKEWINEQLALLLPNEKHPIQFSSLRFPTYIVSTDLSRSEAKVWSQETTPNELVSDAVQASCAIPIFFQPINKRYVDGGLLSNLPAFVFAKRNQSDRPLASRVLAFSLVADAASLDDWNTKAFLQLLANTVVDGSQKLQLDMLSNVHVVSIPTGMIKATDFDKMTPEATATLIQNGIDATKSFFSQELLNVRSSPSTESVCFGTDEMYTRVTESLDLSLDRVVVAENNTDWVYSLFPSILCWRARGVRVDVLLPALGDKPDGIYRRQLLRALGVHVVEIEGAAIVPLRAFLIVPHDAAQSRAVVGVEKQSRTQTIEASYYQGFLDSAVIRAVLGQLDAAIKRDLTTVLPVPALSNDGQDSLFQRLRTVGQYSKPGIDIGISNVPIDRLISLTRFVREYKYRQIGHLVQLYRRLGLSLFEPAAVILGANFSSIVTPPVVEEVDGKYVLVEGSTRATFCRDEGATELKCVVVRGVVDPLPSNPVPFSQVRVIGRTLEANQRYEEFNYNNFRSIERAVHPLSSFERR